MHRFNRSLPTIIILALAAQALGGCVEIPAFTATESREQLTAHVEDTVLQVTSTNGAINVVAAPDRDDVLISAELTAGGMSKEQAEERLAESVLNVTRLPNRTLSISVDFPTPTTGRDRADITVHIPSASQVRITSANGAVAVSGMDSTLNATTTNGRITIRDHRGDADVASSNGAISLERHVGAVKARTTNGRVGLTDHDGQADIATSNGRITVSLVADQAGPLKLRTTNGRIEVEVGPGFAGEMSLSSNNGSLNVNDDAGTVRSQNIERRSGTLTFSQPGEASELRTGNGRITVTTVK